MEIELIEKHQNLARADANMVNSENYKKYEK